MAPVMECAEVATGTMGIQRAATPSCRTTTLYDLIAALQDIVDPDDDALVVATVVHLLRSGRLTWREKAGGHLGQARHTATRARQRGSSVAKLPRRGADAPVWAPLQA